MTDTQEAKSVSAVLTITLDGLALEDVTGLYNTLAQIPVIAQSGQVSLRVGDGSAIRRLPMLRRPAGA